MRNMAKKCAECKEAVELLKVYIQYTVAVNSPRIHRGYVRTWKKAKDFIARNDAK